MPESVLTEANGNFAYLPIGSKTMITTPTSVWEVDDSYSPLSGKMLVEGENEGDPDVTYNIYKTQTGFYAEEADEGVWDDGSLVFAGVSARANYAPGKISAAQDITHMEPGENEGDPETEVYDGTLFTFGTGKVGGLINALVAGDDGLYMLGALISFYAQYDVDLVSYFDGSLYVAPNSGAVQLTLEFGWATNENWAVTFTSMYYPGVASLAASFEASMLDVINA